MQPSYGDEKIARGCQDLQAIKVKNKDTQKQGSQEKHAALAEQHT
jgi:hypothetical protein